MASGISRLRRQLTKLKFCTSDQIFRLNKQVESLKSSNDSIERRLEALESTYANNITASTIAARTSATLRKITDLRNFSHKYYASLRSSVTHFENRYGAP